MEQNPNSIIEGTVKFRDGKKWKSRWCVMRKLSPVADCVHLQLYKDSKERQRNGQTKASLSLQKFLGFESGFTLDKESNTLAILCEDVIPVLAFDTREILIQWRVKVSHNLGSSRQFAATALTAPARSGVRAGPLRLHARAARLAAVAGRPPALLAVWDVALLRRYGVVEGRFCVEGGSRCGRGAGLFVFAAERGAELSRALDAASEHARVARTTSVMEKRFSDTASCAEDMCCHGSLRSVSPSWNLPNNHVCMSDIDNNPLDASISSEIGPNLSKRPTTLTRCSSCMGKIGGPLTRSSTMATTPGGMSLLSPGWIMDSVTEKRSDSDRGSIYSRSSGSASEYSVPRSTCILDKSFESKRASPVACCTPAIPAKVGSSCQCWQLQGKQCSCPRKKQFSGPYENYDVPKTPMPLIHEHPTDTQNLQDNIYDTPKRLTKCLVDSSSKCTCSHQNADQEMIEDNGNNNTIKDVEIEISEHTKPERPLSESHSNYVNIGPVLSETSDCQGYGNYVNVDLSVTLEKFESSMQILRSAGFSQEEIDALEDIPETEDENSTTLPKSNGVHPSTECCDDHLNYMHMEPLENITSTSSAANDKTFSDNVSHLSDPTSLSYEDHTISSQRRSSSADFLKRAEACHDFYKSHSHKDVAITMNELRKTSKNECISDKPFADKDKVNFKAPEAKTKSENSFVARFRDSVKIRRSSSVPSKTEKNRDSSSSNDSGVSTGSLKHHKCDFSEFELPITSSKSCKKHMKSSKQMRKTFNPSHLSMFIKSNSSDPLKNLTFQFEEVATLTKSNSFEADTLTRRVKPKGTSSLDGASNARNSHITSQSTSSGASDMSDYIESLSMSSFSSYDVSDNTRQVTAVLRPRSGKEYLSIDRALLVGACNVDPSV